MRVCFLGERSEQTGAWKNSFNKLALYGTHYTDGHLQKQLEQTGSVKINETDERWENGRGEEKIEQMHAGKLSGNRRALGKTAGSHRL